MSVTHHCSECGNRVTEFCAEHPAARVESVTACTDVPRYSEEHARTAAEEGRYPDLFVTLLDGQRPPRGATVELRRLSFGPGAPSVVETFVADGAWVTPTTVSGFCYVAALIESG